MGWNRFIGIVLLGVCFTVVGQSTARASIEENLRTIKSVGAEGAGHKEAIAAMKSLSLESADALPTILRSFEGANPLAVNWLRSAVDAIADRTLRKTGKLPAESLEKIVKDTKQTSEARRLAYDWLLKVDSSATERLIPGMLHDPSTEFRRDAVQRLIDLAKDAKQGEKREIEKKLLLEALSGATDDDQVKAIVEPLKEMGEKIDLQKHFGFLTTWQLIGPFDNAELKGFDAVYPPERQIDLKAKYQGKMGEVEWKSYSTEDDFGTLDIAKLTAPHKGAVTYATTTFVADKEREIEIRIGTPNAWKLWVNDKLIFGRDEYHRGTFFDQYKIAAKLKPGPNTIMLKLCQNEQTEEWAQAWTFQLRICDQSGLAISPASVAKRESDNNAVK
jgi:hypothetical protein